MGSCHSNIYIYILYKYIVNITIIYDVHTMYALPGFKNMDFRSELPLRQTLQIGFSGEGCQLPELPGLDVLDLGDLLFG